MRSDKRTLRFLASRQGRRVALGLALCLPAACADFQVDRAGRYAAPIGGAPVISNETVYSDALRCLAHAARIAQRPRPSIAVGNIADVTGREELETGRPVSQGAALMAISALSKGGAKLVERFDTSIGELELQYANNKLIRDGRKHRRVLSASIPGSDFYLVGGITELNYNIRSFGFDGFGGETKGTGAKINSSARVFVMNVGIDLRLVRTQTLEVVDVVSYQKQIKGREISAGIFDILGTTLVDASAGERSLEPVQLAVRMVIERSILEMLARLYEINMQTCRTPDNDPLLEQRKDPYRWLSPPPGVGRTSARTGPPKPSSAKAAEAPEPASTEGPDGREVTYHSADGKPGPGEERLLGSLSDLARMHDRSRGVREGPEAREIDPAVARRKK